MKTSFLLFILIIFLGQSCVESSQLEDSFETSAVDEKPASSKIIDSVSSIIPQSGSTTINTNITILGNGLSTGVVSLSIGTVACTNITIINDGQLTCQITPQGAGQYDISIRKNGKLINTITNGFTYISDFGAAFSVYSIAPNSGGIAGATLITVNGSDFDASVIFQIGGSNCAATVIINATTGTCLTAAAAVGLEDFSAKKGPESKTLTHAFQYIGPPTITAVDRSNVPATTATIITITGTNLVAGTDIIFQTNIANYNCTSVIANAAGTEIICSTPALMPAIAASITGPATIKLINPDGTFHMLAAALTFDLPPIFGSINFTAGITAAPIDGIMKTDSSLGVENFTMSIFGSDFKPGLILTIGGLATPACTRISSSQINCTSLPDQGSTLTTSKNLVIINTDGQNLTQIITMAGRPNISAISPGMDAPSGGTDIDFSGSNLTGSAPTITFRNDANSADLGTCAIVSHAIPRCTVPAIGSAQNIDIRYLNSYGYTEDFDGLFVVADAAVMSITYPGNEDGDGTNALGKMGKGSVATIVARIHNTSGSVPITGISFDTTALAVTNFSYDAGPSTCVTTIAPGANCDLYFNYDASTIEVVEETAPIIVSYHNGIATDVLSFSFAKTWVAPMKTLWKHRHFGDIPNGVNHNSVAASFVHVLQIHNPSKNNMLLDVANTTFSGAVFSFAGGSFPGAHSSVKFTDDTCPVSGIIPSESKCFLILEFTPSSTISFSESLTLTYNGAETKTITLTGDSSAATKTNCNPVGSTSFGGGAGTSADPYLLCSLKHMEDLSDFTIAESGTYPYRESYYLQTANIDLSSPVGGEIEPIKLDTGSYGHYNGGGYKLSNWQWSTAGLNQTAGLFYQNGFYQNLQLIDFNSVCLNDCGGIVNKGKISINNSYITGDILASASRGGSITTTISGNSLIDNVYTFTDITTKDYSSFLISGHAVGAVVSIQNSYFFGSLTDSGVNAGNGGLFNLISSATVSVDNVQMAATLNFKGKYSAGFVGVLYGAANLTITNSNFSGTLVTNGTYTGGFIGYTETAAILLISKCGTDGVINTTTYGGGYCGTCSGVNQTVSNSYMNTKLTTAQHGGGIAGHIGNVQDTMTTGSHISLNTNISQGGGIGSNIYYDFDNNYIARIPRDEWVYSYGGNYEKHAVFGSTIPMTPTNNYFLDGQGIDQSASTGIYKYSASQMRTSLPGLSDNTAVWKYGIGYPYPMLKWMDDDWMP